jgi:branched-chain amino acid transport system substrate-binding protein
VGRVRVAPAGADGRDRPSPVSAQAEASGVPCVLTICPWEQWYYKSSGAANTFKYSYMYFLGTQEETNLFSKVWANASTNHVVGGLWPDDVDGAGFEKYMKAKLGGLGRKVVPSGAYADGTSPGRRRPRPGPSGTAGRI